MTTGTTKEAAMGEVEGTVATTRIDAPPLRSILFVPGHRQRWVEPARASGTDGIVFDLEDAVPVSEIDEARRVVHDAVERFAVDGPKVLVRVAPPASDALALDLDAVVNPGLCAVVLPLVYSPDEVRQVADRLDLLEAQRGMEVGSTVIMPLVETAEAARLAFEIANASERVEYMGGGTSRQGDIARALGYRWTPEGTETLTMRSWVLLCVRAAGVRYPVTGLWGQVDDLDGCRQWAEQARGLGYTGTTVIHPSHVPIVNEAFSPSRVEIEHWTAVVATMEACQAQGIGATTFEGAMIDEADVKTARLGLELAGRLGRPAPGQ